MYAQALQKAIKYQQPFQEKNYWKLSKKLFYTDEKWMRWYYIAWGGGGRGGGDGHSLYIFRICYSWFHENGSYGEYTLLMNSI